MDRRTLPSILITGPLVFVVGVVGMWVDGAVHQARPPGWVCERGACDAAEGWHIELHEGQQIAVHDYARRSVRQRDTDTADAWHLLTNSQRQAILKGDAEIYDYVDFKGD